MCLPFTCTTADAMDWDEAMDLVRNLYRDGNYTMSLLVATGCFTGLRVSDILSLRYSDLFSREFEIIEKKTRKRRTIRVNADLREHAFRLAGRFAKSVYFQEEDCIQHPKDQRHLQRVERTIRTAGRALQHPFHAKDFRPPRRQDVRGGQRDGIDKIERYLPALFRHDYTYIPGTPEGRVARHLRSFVYVVISC